MREASFISSCAQASFALYLGITLARGAKTSARRTLARSLLLSAAYGAALAVLFTTGSGTSRWDLFGVIGVALGVAGLFDLGAFAWWSARGALPDAPTHRPRALFAVGYVVLLALCVGGSVAVLQGVSGDEAMGSLLIVTLVTTIAIQIAFAVAWRRGVPGGRAFFLACLWPVAPMVLSLAMAFGADVPNTAFRLIRDVCMIVFNFSLFRSYLDEGHEPMSLRVRIVGGVLVAVLALGAVSAELLLPLAAPAAEGASLFVAHQSTFILLLLLAIAYGVVIAFAPAIYRKSVLEPLERLTAGLAKVEAGEHVVLPVGKDEIGRLAGSFNDMSSALAEGREALAERLHQLEERQREIEDLNDELRRQIAARSRQLADALKDVDRDAKPIQPGMTIEARYLVGEALGAGGMGIVFAARRLHDDRELALKVILGGSPEDAVRFMREAEIAATLDHPNLVSVIDVGMRHGTPYFVMERLAGGSLAGVAKRFGDTAFVLPILVQVARGLSALHARGILHRDLKPANVLLDGDPESPVAKIGDFGIAGGAPAVGFAATMDVREVALGSFAAKTDAGRVMGTLPYMAPELATPGFVWADPSDVFSFGVLGWEIVVGALPFLVPVILTVGQGGVIPPPHGTNPDAPSELLRLLERCLRQSPSERPTVAELVGDLSAIAGAAKDAGTLRA